MNVRRVYEWAVPTLAVLSVPLLSLLYADRIPDPMAIHWGADGQPDGSGPVWVDAVLTTTVTAFLGLGPLVALRAVRNRDLVRILVASAHGIAVFMAGLHWATLLHNAGAQRWQDASGFGPGSFAAVAGVSLLSAGLGWVAAGDRPEAEVPTREPAEVAIAHGEDVVWSGRAAGRLVVAVSLGAAVGAAAILLTVPGISGVVLAAGTAALVAAIGLTLTSARVVIGPRGVRASLGALGWPRHRVALDEVTGVDVIEVEPAAFGGWGYRVIPGARALIVRRGEGLRVRRADAPDLVVTVDDARTGAGVLLAHLRQHDPTRA